MENLFEMDESNQEIHQTLKKKFSQVEKSDILEVVDADVKNKGNFSIIKIKPECRDKYDGHEKIATALRRLSTSPGKRAGYMVEMLGDLIKQNKMDGELMIADVSSEALEYIKKAKKK